MLSKSLTKAELKEAHQNKMLYKKQRQTELTAPRHFIRANLSRNHPDASCTVQQHLINKTARNK
jgi:hypothetical protein